MRADSPAPRALLLSAAAVLAACASPPPPSTGPPPPAFDVLPFATVVELAEEYESSAHLARRSGAWDDAEDLYERAAQHFETARLQRRRGDCLHQLAYCYEPSPGTGTAGRWRLARRTYGRAAAAYEAAGHQPGRMDSYRELARCHMPTTDPRGGSWRDARRVYEEVERLATVHDDPRRRASAIDRQAWCIDPRNDEERGDAPRARALYAEAARRYDGLHDATNHALSLERLAHCFRPDVDPEGDWTRAAGAHLDAAIACERAGLTKAHRNSLYSRAAALAWAALDNARWIEAADALEHVADLCARAGEFEKERDCHEWMEECVRRSEME
jgi:tetratricopeptide (TPR) repeat protein